MQSNLYRNNHNYIKETIDILDKNKGYDIPLLIY